MRSIILASGSPRRSMILTQAGIPFQVILPTLSEERTNKVLPEEVVEDLSRQKAEDVATGLSVQKNFLVIGADTIVSYKDHILGKPADTQDAVAMLTMLQGHLHQVYTGVTFVYDRNGVLQTHTFHVKTEVEMSPMSDVEVSEYVASGEPMDKAGAYAIQGRGCIYIKSIHGEYYNVVGFPIAQICSEYRKLGL